MFWGIFIFRLHLTRGPESVTCDNEQNAWPILFCKLTQKPALATAITGEKKLGRGLEKNEIEWTRKVEISSRMKSLAVRQACMAVFRPTPGF